MDYAKAESLYLSAANNGNATAMSQLAGLYFKGINGKRDEQKAIQWYRKAADLGNREANYQLGLLSETGVGTKIDFKDALNYYQKAANLGNDKAKLALARMYQYGLGVTKDLNHAADIYKELADNNNAYAQYQLGVFYMEGALGERKPEQGRRLLQSARDNGSNEAIKFLQSLEANQKLNVSFIESAPMHKLAELQGKTPDHIYFDAMNDWNRGDEAGSRLILQQLIGQFPNYVPAKRAYEQINQVTNQPPYLG